jgi:uncharacterized protein (DUF486 family)
LATLLYYANYYLYQAEIYSIDLAIGFVVYSYLTYMYVDWEKSSCVEHTNVKKLDEIMGLGFYSLFMVYWLYDAFLQFSYHNEPNILVQIGNVYMSTAWYFYFSTCSLLYYFVCIKLAQRAQSINEWLKSLKHTKLSLDEFLNSYKKHHKVIKVFGRNWNFIVFTGFVILTYHIPIDIISVFIHKQYANIAGIIVKTLGLGWYTYKICTLNDTGNKVIPYLYKHNLFPSEHMKIIEKYADHHDLGLKFYGIKIDGLHILKFGLLFINFVLPTIYALVSNKLVGNG